MKNVRILAIDTSCDDTSVAVLEKDCVLSNIVSSQVEIHSQWGGVVPILAKRAHIEYIDNCIEMALKRSKTDSIKDLSAIAVTYGPGLAPALEVGIEKAKNLAIKHDVPLIGVNHMEGHLLSALLRNSNGNYYAKVDDVKFPWICMTVSGGHTEIIRVKEIGKYEIIGRTLDDAAGEAFDKVARMLGLGYPGGAVIEKFSKDGNESAYSLPRPMQRNKGYDFSFSGLKTACLYSTNDLKKELGENFSKVVPDYCASLQEAIVDSLLIKMKKAVKKFSPKTILVGGGVSANNRLRYKFRKTFEKFQIPVYFPDKKFCMDNAAMIGLAAYHKYKRGEWAHDKSSLDRVPNLSLHNVDMS